MQLSGNTILITGGSAGIGLALAAELVRRGNEVVVCGRRSDRLEAARKKLPQLHTFVADVGDPESRGELVGWTLSRYPALNILVNNAGIQSTFDLNGGTRDLLDADQEIAINLTAPIHLSALLIEHLATKPSAAIVNLTSGLAFAPLAHVPIYCATKAALHSLSLTLRHQLRNTSVRLFEVAPPIVATELGQYHRPPGLNATAMTAETAAEGIVRAMEADEYEVALGDAANLREKREAVFSAMNRG